MAEEDDMGEEISRWGLRGMTGIGGWIGGGVGEWNVDRRDKWGRTARNSSVLEMLSSRVNGVSNFQARLLMDHCWGILVSSSSLSEGKKSDEGWFLGVLGGDSGCEGSCQL